MKTTNKKTTIQFDISGMPLIPFIKREAQKNYSNSLLQLLTVLFAQNKSTQDMIWWTLFLHLWNNAPEKGEGLSKKQLLTLVLQKNTLTKAEFRHVEKQLHAFLEKQVSTLANTYRKLKITDAVIPPNSQ